MSAPAELQALFAKPKAARSQVDLTIVDWLRDVLRTPRPYQEVEKLARREGITPFELVLAAAVLNIWAPCDPRGLWRAERPEATNKPHWRT